MTKTHYSVDLDEETREAAERLSDSDNPLAPIASIFCHLDDGVSIERLDE